MSKILVNPDIHGRTFWVKPCEDIDSYDKVIFLGDYFDPYSFEKITVEDAIKNFKNIIELKNKYDDKVVLLLGNHDMPYFSSKYYDFSDYHCRHSKKYHKEIKKLFDENKRKFKIAHVENDIIFTHAGIESGWLNYVVKCNSDDINVVCDELNKLIDSREGLLKLYNITRARGGYDKYGSCIWADYTDITYDVYSLTSTTTKVLNSHRFKQVFGHSLQAFYGQNNKIVFGDAVEFGNCKMLDTAKPYVLDCENFKVEPIKHD